MKIFIQLIVLALFSVCLVSCSKKKDPPSKPRGYFVKTIELVFPAGAAQRKSTFEYDEKNRIKKFEFRASSVIYLNTFTYNDQDLITRADQDLVLTGTDRTYGSIFEFKYTAGILNEYIEDGMSYPVIYNATNNSYSYGTRTYFWDVNNNLKRLVTGARTRLEINYLSGSGVFRYPTAEMAFAIFNENVSRSISTTYAAAIDTYAFSKNEIGNINDNELRINYLSSIRDENGNITQTDVKNAAGDLTYRYIYTYEMREVE